MGYKHTRKILVPGSKLLTNSTFDFHLGTRSIIALSTIRICHINWLKVWHTFSQLILLSLFNNNCWNGELSNFSHFSTIVCMWALWFTFTIYNLEENILRRQEIGENRVAVMWMVVEHKYIIIQVYRPHIVDWRHHIVLINLETFPTLPLLVSKCCN